MGLGDSINVLFRIKADSESARADIKAFQKDLKELEKQAKDGGSAFERLGAASGLSASQFKALHSGALLAAAGITTVTAGALAAAVAVFKLTDVTSEYGSKLFDAQAKTKLSAATLSTLAENAAKAGSDFESIIGSVSKFTVLLGQAQQGSDKAKDTLAKYGIVTTDTTTALDEAIKSIAAMETVEQRAAAARELFKDKSLALLPVIEQLNGSLSEATKETIRTGRAMTEQGIIASDDFGDALTDLQGQTAATARAFAVELMPKMTQAIQAVTDVMIANKGTASAWGTYLINTLTGLTIVFKGLGKAAEDTFAIITLGMTRTAAGAEVFKVTMRAALDFAFAGLPTAIANLERIGALMPDSVNSGPLKYADPNRGNSQPYTGMYSPEGQKKFSDWQFDQEQKAIEEAKKAEEKAAEERKKARERDLAAQRESVRIQIQLLNDYFDSDQKGFKEAYLNREITDKEWRETSTRNFAIYAQNVSKLLRDALALDSQGKTPLEISNLKQSSQRAAGSANNNIAQAIEDREKTITGVIKDQIKEREKDDKEWFAYLKESLDVQGEEYIQQVKEWADKVTKEMALLGSLPGVPLPVPTMSTEGQPKANPFQPLIDGWRALKAEMEGSVGMTNILNSLGMQFIDFARNMASAVGSSVAAWALYGDSIGQSLKKALAAQLAHIAAVAVVNALYATALGFLRLAQWDFAGATNAFISAGIWAAVATATGLGAKAVAGNSFKQSTANGGSSASANDPASQNNNFQSGQFGGFGNRLNNTLAAVEDGINTLNTKIFGMREGEVLARGIDQNPNALSDGFISGLQNNPRITGALKRATGDAR